MTTEAMRVNRVSRAGNVCERRAGKPAINKNNIGGMSMPRGRSTFTKRQKEQTRQQRQREKAERRTQRKEEKPQPGSIDEMAELREHAAAQAALFNVGEDESDDAEEPAPNSELGIEQ